MMASRTFHAILAVLAFMATGIFSQAVLETAIPSSKTRPSSSISTVFVTTTRTITSTTASPLIFIVTSTEVITILDLGEKTQTETITVTSARNWKRVLRTGTSLEPSPSATPPSSTAPYAPRRRLRYNRAVAAQEEEPRVTTVTTEVLTTVFAQESTTITQTVFSTAREAPNAVTRVTVRTTLYVPEPQLPAQGGTPTQSFGTSTRPATSLRTETSQKATPATPTTASQPTPDSCGTPRILSGSTQTDCSTAESTRSSSTTTPITPTTPSTTSSAPSPPDTQPTNRSFPLPTTAGILLGSLFGALLAALAIRYLIRRVRQQQQATRPPPAGVPPLNENTPSRSPSPSTNGSEHGLTGGRNEVRVVIRGAPAAQQPRNEDRRRQVWPMPPGREGQRPYSVLVEPEQTTSPVPSEWSDRSDALGPGGGEAMRAAMAAAYRTSAAPSGEDGFAEVG
ncbi:hypothetical protein B0T19DRAFT_473176 [Cercophora scortea]|uniref:Uncharacterized protein n=1 Tax=Cercophora scortea TaxID=314031 RepID=A0AAE0MGZ1_9PEZI|nr:hypothetical protein B0T19DRAFT_473176 [Cercophora scortea]